MWTNWDTFRVFSSNADATDWLREFLDAATAVKQWKIARFILQSKSFSFAQYWTMNEMKNTFGIYFTEMNSRQAKKVSFS